jgi:hypothetical protein
MNPSSPRNQVTGTIKGSEVPVPHRLGVPNFWTMDPTTALCSCGASFKGCTSMMTPTHFNDAMT